MTPSASVVTLSRTTEPSPRVILNTAPCSGFFVWLSIFLISRPGFLVFSTVRV